MFDFFVLIGTFLILFSLLSLKLNVCKSNAYIAQLKASICECWFLTGFVLGTVIDSFMLIQLIKP